MFYNCTIEKEGDEFIVRFPDMTNIVTCGFSHDEALSMAKEALDGCLEADISRGYIAPPPSFSGGYPIEVAPRIAAAIQPHLLRKSKKTPPSRTRRAAPHLSSLISFPASLNFKRETPII